MKKKWMLTLGAAALSTLFAPDANAGCGKELISKMSVLLPGDQPQPQAAIAEAKAEQGPVPAGSAVGLWAVN